MSFQASGRILVPASDVVAKVLAQKEERLVFQTPALPQGPGTQIFSSTVRLQIDV